MFSIIQAAGWPIWPLLMASIIAVALIIERLAALRRSKVVPPGLLQRVVAEYRQNGVTGAMVGDLEAHSPLGRVLGAGLRNVGSSREIMKEAIEQGRFSLDGMIDTFRKGEGSIASASEETRDLSESWQVFKNQIAVKLEPVAVGVFDAVNAALIFLIDHSEIVKPLLFGLIAVLVALAAAVGGFDLVEYGFELFI